LLGRQPACTSVLDGFYFLSRSGSSVPEQIFLTLARSGSRFPRRFQLLLFDLHARVRSSVHFASVPPAGYVVVFQIRFCHRSVWSRLVCVWCSHLVTGINFVFPGLPLSTPGDDFHSLLTFRLGSRSALCSRALRPACLDGA
jgi:hypothetical protein